MAFDEVRLDVFDDSPVTSSMYVKSWQATSDSGVDSISTNWTEPLLKWDLGNRNITETTKDLLVTFFMARRGPVNGFRFKDITSYTLTAQNIGVGDGTNKAFQVVKTTLSQGFTNTKVIKKLVSGTVTVYMGAVDITSSTVIDYNTGLITFNTAPTSGVQITVSCQYDLPVRFSSNTLQIKPLTLDSRVGWVFNLGPLSLVEDRR